RPELLSSTQPKLGGQNRSQRLWQELKIPVGVELSEKKKFTLPQRKPWTRFHAGHETQTNVTGTAVGEWVSMSDLDEVIKDFLVESYENLDRLDRDLITLEGDPTNREGLASIFRTIHTIKGTCGFFEFNQLASVTHSGENLLSQL